MPCGLRRFSYVVLLVLLPLFPWQRPVQLADPWPPLAAELERLGAEEVFFGGWILCGKSVPDGLARSLAARAKSGDAAVSLQAAPGPEGLHLLSFRTADRSSCPGMMGEAVRLLRGGGSLQGWTAEALLAGGPADAPRLAGLLAEELRAEVHSVYREDGHVNLVGYCPVLPAAFEVDGSPVNLNLDLRYDRHRGCLRLRAGAPVLLSPLIPSPAALQ